MRRLLLFYLLLSLAVFCNLQAQEKYSINEYGTYVVASGVIKKIPTTVDLRTYFFWKNYILFGIWGKSNLVIYNIDSGAVSEIISEILNGEGKIIEDDRYFVIFVYYQECIYRLDPVSLAIIEKEYVGKLYTYPDTIGGANFETVKYEKIGERTMRYTGKDNYIEINYGQKIIMEGRHGGRRGSYDGYLCRTNNDSTIYVIEVYEIDHGAEE